jgi:serine/threonine protein kinase
LRGENKHPNIVELVDVQGEWLDDEPGGAGTAGCLSIALPLFRSGSLKDAIDKKTMRSYPRKAKVSIAHGLLSAVAFLHDNDILHRDIKTDNVMLSNSDDTWTPILIDFSLAKMAKETEPIQHTGEVGTVTYNAPEVVAREPYGKPCDLWSVGVCLLELLLDQPLPAYKDRHAFNFIDEALARLPNDQPFPDLLKGILQKDPAKRLTARQALEHSLFAKFDFEVPPVRVINIAEALPVHDYEEENESPNNPISSRKTERLLEKRAKTIDRICRELGAENPLTSKLALEYAQALTQLDDTIDDLSQSQSLLNCAVLAFRFIEVEVLDLEEFDNAEKGTFAEWTLEDYVDDEATLFMLMDYCLYPRRAFSS